MDQSIPLEKLDYKHVMNFALKYRGNQTHAGASSGLIRSQTLTDRPTVYIRLVLDVTNRIYTFVRVVKVRDRMRLEFTPEWVRFPPYFNAKFITNSVPWEGTWVCESVNTWEYLFLWCIPHSRTANCHAGPESLSGILFMYVPHPGSVGITLYRYYHARLWLLDYMDRWILPLKLASREKNLWWILHWDTEEIKPTREQVLVS